MKISLNTYEVIEICLNVKQRADIVIYKADSNPLLCAKKTYQGGFVYPNFVEFLEFFGGNFSDLGNEIEEHFKNNPHYISVCKNGEDDTFFILKEMFTHNVISVNNSMKQLINSILECKENELSM